MVAVVTDRERDVYTGAAGERVLGSGAEMTPDTVGAISSTTKAVTGTVCLQPVEEGERVLEPLGMSDTSFTLTRRRAAAWHAPTSVRTTDRSRRCTTSSCRPNPRCTWAVTASTPPRWTTALSNDAESFPGSSTSWSPTFTANDGDAPTGRPAGSPAWAGLADLSSWIDRHNGIAGSWGTQVFPIADAVSVQG